MYKESKENLRDLRQKERQARDELKELRQERSTIDNQVSKAFNVYTDLKAKHHIGDCSDKELLKTEQQYLKLTDRRESLQQEIQVAERVADIVKSKLPEAESEFRQHATARHREELQPLFKEIQASLDTINKAIDQANDYRRTLQSDQVNDSILKGIKRHSRAVITTKNNGSLGMKDFITQLTEN